jgi:hypothetical protein
MVPEDRPRKPALGAYVLRTSVPAGSMLILTITFNGNQVPAQLVHNRLEVFDSGYQVFSFDCCH